VPLLPNSAIDAFDRALLAQVQQNNLTSARVLAERVGLSESAVLRRLRRLRAEGVIAADVAVVRPATLGRPVIAIVLVKLMRESRAQVDAFGRRMQARPEVAATWYVTGSVDFVVILNLPDLAAYDAFTSDVFLADSNVAKFETLMSLRELITAPPHVTPRGITGRESVGRRASAAENRRQSTSRRDPARTSMKAKDRSRGGRTGR
jgi:Lrp/AsnC family transcriptional regulator, leucine-responsive regulatory protein